MKMGATGGGGGIRHQTVLVLTTCLLLVGNLSVALAQNWSTSPSPRWNERGTFTVIAAADGSSDANHNSHHGTNVGPAAGSDWGNMTVFRGPVPRSGHALAYDTANGKLVLFGGVTGWGLLGDTWVYDVLTGNWTKTVPANSPLPRYGHTMTYDSVNGKVVLFGGTTTGGTRLGDTWVFDVATSAWTNKSPPSAPSEREAPAMAFDIPGGKAVLFGGWNTSPPGGYNVLGDTWTYDLAANSWKNMSPLSSPPARFSHAMAYVGSIRGSFVYGGRSAAAFFGDSWSYNMSANTWTNKTPVTSPSPRLDSAMAYDAASGAVVLFGGRRGDTFLNDTWAFDSAAGNWTDKTPAVAPSPRYGHAMAYTDPSGEVLLFGGCASGSCPKKEMWVYDATSNLWMNKALETSPSYRTYHAMAYDSEHRKVVLFGGATGGGGASNETWSYDTSSNTWRDARPASAPSPRYGHAMAYDSANRRIVLFGGGAPAVSGETWTYDVGTNTWTNMAPPKAPSPRYQHAMAFDDATGKVVLFGGDGNSGRTGDTWVYDLRNNTWTDKAPTAAPSPRIGHAMAYDGLSGKIVLFGGFGSAETFDDTWLYDAESNTWAKRVPGAVPNSRYRHAMVYDGASRKAILFGGQAAGGALGDTWSYDVGGNAWTNLEPANAPVAQSGHAIAYDNATRRSVLFGRSETWVYASGLGNGSNLAPITQFDWYFGSGNNTNGTSPGAQTSMNITIRLAGSKGNSVTAALLQDTKEIANETVTRTSGKPDEKRIQVVLDTSSAYTLRLFYDGQQGGSNPVSVTHDLLGRIYTKHIVFNSQQGKNQLVTSNLNDAFKATGIVTFDASRSYDPDGTVDSYAWQFGDGVSGSGPVVVHAYPSNGQYQATLTLTDDAKATASASEQVTISGMVKNSREEVQLSGAATAFLSDAGYTSAAVDGPAVIGIRDSSGNILGSEGGPSAPTSPFGFVAQSAGPVEVGYTASGAYSATSRGEGPGQYQSTLFRADPGLSKEVALAMPATSSTKDTLRMNSPFDEFRFSIAEDSKKYDLALSTPTKSMKVTGIQISRGETHIITVKDWAGLDTSGAVTLGIDTNGDGGADTTIPLKGGMTGEDINSILEELRTQSRMIMLLSIAAIILSIMALATAVVLHRRKTLGLQIVDEVFLVYKDGRLIKHMTRRLKPDRDEDILSGMLFAVQEFVKDSFKGEKGELDELKFGEYRIIMRRGKWTMAAVVIGRQASEGLLRQTEALVAEIEQIHASALRGWDGSAAKLAGAGDQLKKFLAGGYRRTHRKIHAGKARPRTK